MKRDMGFVRIVIIGAEKQKKVFFLFTTPPIFNCAYIGK